MTIHRVIAAVAGGLALAALPFLRYAHFGGGSEAHADHEPRHGGQLGMVGEHHIEVVRQRGQVEVFVSDAWRRPVEPAHGWVAFDGGVLQLLAWRDHRLIGTDRPAATVAVEVVLAGGARIATSFRF